MKEGYYWIRVKISRIKTIGHYDPDGTGGEYYWKIIGSDEIYNEKELEVIREVK